MGIVSQLFPVSYESPSMLDLLEDFMELRKIPFARLDGSTCRPRRNLDIRLVGYDRFIPVTRSNIPPSFSRRNRVCSPKFICSAG